MRSLHHGRAGDHHRAARLPGATGRQLGRDLGAGAGTDPGARGGLAIQTPASSPCLGSSQCCRSSQQAHASFTKTGFEPRWDSCDGEQSTYGRDPAVVDADFSTGAVPRQQVVVYVRAAMRRLGWAYDPEVPAEAN